MGGVAALARAAGHEVTGCDRNVYPPMSTQLKSLGIEIHEGVDASRLPIEEVGDADLHALGWDQESNISEMFPSKVPLGRAHAIREPSVLRNIWSRSEQVVEKPRVDLCVSREDQVGRTYYAE